MQVASTQQKTSTQTNVLYLSALLVTLQASLFASSSVLFWLTRDDHQRKIPDSLLQLACMLLIRYQFDNMKVRL